MRTLSHAHKISVMLLAVVFAGCVTNRAYEGAAQSSEKIAVIETQAIMAGLGYWIWPAVSHIDGKKTAKTEIYNSMRRFQRFEVLPGKHSVGVIVVSRHHSGTGSYDRFPTNFSLEAKAGCVYRIKLVKKQDGKGWNAVIVEKTSHQQ